MFTYGSARRPEGVDGRPSLATVVEALGEPFRSSMERDDVVAMLARAGLPAPAGPDPGMIRGCWLGERSDGLEPPKRDRPVVPARLTLIILVPRGAEA